MTVLTGSDEQAIAQIRALLPPRAGPRRPRPAGLPAPRWLQLSQPARGRFLRALDPDLGPADRIRYRTGTPQAAIPDDPPGLLAARARAIPQLLWPDWAIRLARPQCCPSLKIPMKAALVMPMSACRESPAVVVCGGALLGVVPVVVGEVPGVMCR